ncbi:MAG: DUF294 nucleotidyltransferase-like domain-containing protein [Desulfohalobiaceae bacterium]
MRIDPEQLARISSCSAYLATLLRQEGHYNWLVQEKRLLRSYPLVELFRELLDRAVACSAFQDLALLFRDFKQKHFLRIAGRECLGWAGFRETTQQLSDLAAVCLQAGLEILCRRPELWLQPQEAADWEDRDSGSLAVLGLGKLGGYELNYVSDVDLFFLRGDMPGQELESSRLKPLQSKLCQSLTSLLGDQVHADRVFKVDLRLRPGGREGELVCSLESALDYYQLRGRSWERQALLKARAVAGNKPLGNEFLQQVRPFVFRRFLDFQALGELRRMRDRILEEASAPGKVSETDIKQGWGGIREIEFLVQSLQLVYGGRYPDLQEPNTLRSLDRLKDLKLLSAQAEHDLRQDYVFLRRLEHWIQLDQNRQNSSLPEGPESRQRLAWALGFAGDFQDLEAQLGERRQRVHQHFQALFQESTSSRGSKARQAAGPGRGSKAQELESRLLQLLPEPGPRILEVLQASLPWGEGSSGALVQDRIQDFLQQLQSRPGLAQALNQADERLQELFTSLGQSAIVHDLLRAQPGLAEGLLQQMGDNVSPWKGCSEVIQGCASFEEALEWVRRFKNERILYLALKDLQGQIKADSLEQELTAIADFTLQQTYRQVARHMGLDQGQHLCVLALGRAGSREMGFGSDLDLAFVYDPAPGEDQDLIPEQVVRFIQRLMRMLSTPLQDGPGYVVDARLRPTGNYGPLVSSRRSWQEYYSSQADIWEIQALLRMRPVAGSKALGQELQEFASRTIFQARSQTEVWPRLCSLRQRMLQERAREGQDQLDLKLGQGGLADLEFLAQGAQLLFGAEAEELRLANIRQVLPGALQSLEISAAEYQVRAFSLYRSLERRLQHLGSSAPSCISAQDLLQMQGLGLWPAQDQALRLENWQDLQQVRRRVSRVWQGICRNFFPKT